MQMSQNIIAGSMQWINNEPSQHANMAIKWLIIILVWGYGVCMTMSPVDQPQEVSTGQYYLVIPPSSTAGAAGKKTRKVSIS